MIILSITIIIAAAIVIFILFRSKVRETYTGQITLNKIKEVAKFINHETFISDFIKITKIDSEEVVALLKIDCKIQFTFDVYSVFNDDSNMSSEIELDSIPEPNLQIIETVCEDQTNDDQITATQFIPIKRGIKLNRSQIEECERKYLENFKKLPKTREQINQSKSRFIEDINTILKTFGSDKSITLKPTLKSEEINSTENHKSSYQYFKVSLDKLDRTRNEKILEEQFKLLISMANADGSISEDEKGIIHGLIDNSLLPDDKMLEYSEALENAKSFTDIDFKLFYSDTELANETLKQLYEIANSDNDFDNNEKSYLRTVAKKMGVKKDTFSQFDIENPSFKEKIGNIFNKKSDSKETLPE